MPKNDDQTRILPIGNFIGKLNHEFGNLHWRLGSQWMLDQALARGPSPLLPFSKLTFPLATDQIQNSNEITKSKYCKSSLDVFNLDNCNYA